MRKIYLLILGVVLFGTSAVAQLGVTVTYTGGAGSSLSGTYPNLAAAVTALNGATFTGAGYCGSTWLSGRYV